MSKKILFKIFISIFLIFGIILFYGFIIGGETGLLFYLIISIFTIMLSFFTFGKKLFSKSKIAEIIILVSVICLLSNGIYLFINNSFDTEIINSYESEIIDEPGNAPFENDYYFKGPDGNIKYYSKYFIAVDFSNFETGDSIYVEEYKGTFGIEHYKISKQ